MRKGFLCSIDGTSPPLLPSIPPFQLSLRHSSLSLSLSLSLSSSVLHIRDASSLFFVLFSPALSSGVRLLECRLPDRWVEEKLLVKAAYWPWSRRRVMSRLVVMLNCFLISNRSTMAKQSLNHSNWSERKAKTSPWKWMTVTEERQVDRSDVDDGNDSHRDQCQ